MITVSKVDNPGVLSRWVRAHRTLAAVVILVCLWAPYGLLDALGVTDPWVAALRPVQGATAAVWPRTCNGVPGNVPCTQFTEDGRRLVYMTDEAGREVAYETTTTAGVVRNTETGMHRLLRVRDVTLPDCTGEAGGSDLPCVWRCESMGNGLCGPNHPPVMIYRRGEVAE